MSNTINDKGRAELNLSFFIALQSKLFFKQLSEFTEIVVAITNFGLSVVGRSL